MSNQLPFRDNPLKVQRQIHGLTQEELAKKLDVTVKTYRSWEQERTTPDIYYLLQLSELYNVSTDYLLGLIAEKSVDSHFVCAYTGLSEEAVEKLHSLSFDKKSKDFVSSLILEYNSEDSGLFSSIVSAIDTQNIIFNSKNGGNVKIWKERHFKSLGANPKIYDSVPEGAEIISAKEALDFQIYEASRKFNNFLHKFTLAVRKNK